MSARSRCRRSHPGAAVLALVLACTGMTAAAEPPASPLELRADLRVEPLLPGVWLVVSSHVLPGGTTPVPANGLLVAGAGGAVLIDTPWTDEQTAALLDWAAGQPELAVKSVVVTHAHPDRLGGLAAVHRRGLASYGLDRTAASAREQGIEAPQHTFSGHLTLQAEPVRIELLFPGPGHTVDNIVAWLPAHGLLFGGCLIKSAQATDLGYVAEADLPAWPKTVAALRATYAPELRHVVPGHGSPGGIELLDRTLELLHQ